MNITFRQLQVFVEVASRLSFAQAASALHLTPPAVTMQIKELERAVGLPLFERHGRSISLSTGGEYFLVYARRMQGLLKEAEDTMARLSGIEKGSLTIGIVGTAKYFVPRLMARFQREYPAIDLKMMVASNREQMYEFLGNREIDLAIMGRAPKELDARAEPFAANPFVFVACADHPLAGESAIPVVRLADYPFVIREPGSGTRHALESLLSQHNTKPIVAMELSSNETIKQAVMANMGLSFMSLHTITLELDSGLLKILPVEDTPLMRIWCISHIRTRTLSPAAEAFRYFVHEHGETYLSAKDQRFIGEGIRAIGDIDPP